MIRGIFDIKIIHVKIVISILFSVVGSCYGYFVNLYRLVPERNALNKTKKVKIKKDFC